MIFIQWLLFFIQRRYSLMSATPSLFDVSNAINALMSAHGEVLFFVSGTQIQTEVSAHFCGGGSKAFPTDWVIQKRRPILQCVQSPIRTSTQPK